MDYIILYNPLSKGGSNRKFYMKLKRQLERKNNVVEVGSLLDITDVEEYLNKLDKNIKIIIIGGDGTLHHLANTLMEYDIKNEIYVVKAGTGNDFIRSIKPRKKLIKVNDYIKDIPYDLVTENETEKRYFLNSVGMGVDAYIAHLVNTTEKGKGKWSYFKNVYKGFMEYNPYDLTVEIDGEVKTFEKTWLAVVANSKYLGGGMKISPKSKRLDDELEVVVVHNMSRFFVFLIFPLIYLGWHVIFKKRIKVYKGKEIKFKTDVDKHVQYDGETSYPRRKIDVYRK